MSFGTLILTAGQTLSDSIVFDNQGESSGFFMRVRGILLTDFDLASHISLGEVENILGNSASHRK